MVLDLQDKKLFKQKDVRETAGISGTPIIGDFTTSQHSHAAAGATGGTVDHVNLTNKGTNTHAQVDSHIANTANPHTVILTDLATAGEGIDFAGATINGENCSDTNKGIAVFPIADFTVTAGSVALKAIVVTSVDGDAGTATPAVHNIDILGGTGISTLGAGNDLTITNTGVTSAVAGAGIDVSAATGAVTVSCEDSTAGNKGIIIATGGNGINVAYAAGNATLTTVNGEINHDALLNFAANEHFTEASITHTNITAGDGSDHSLLTNKTSYWTISGNAFKAQLAADTDDTVNVTRGIYASGEGGVSGDENAIHFHVDVHLPQGAVVTAINVYGNAGATGETFRLVRHEVATVDQQTLMASSAIGTEDTTITNGTIDNETYAYFISTTSLDSADIIYGARITYTTDYD